MRVHAFKQSTVMFTPFEKEYHQIPNLHVYYMAREFEIRVFVPVFVLQPF